MADREVGELGVQKAKEGPLIKKWVKSTLIPKMTDAPEGAAL